MLKVSFLAQTQKDCQVECVAQLSPRLPKLQVKECLARNRSKDEAWVVVGGVESRGPKGVPEDHSFRRFPLRAVSSLWREAGGGGLVASGEWAKCSWLAVSGGLFSAPLGKA